MSLIITDAFADTPASSFGGFDVMSFLPLILIFAVFYFLILRPQQRKLKTHQQMLANLRRGDRVVTNGGIIGTVSKLVSDQEVQIEVADDVKVRVMRSMISDVMSKTDPVANDDADAAQSKGTKKKSSE
jgi:preprotein translocase subunit YajC